MIKRNDVTNILITLPNKLTIGRILAVPLLIVLYPINVSILNIFCAILFLAAAMTDFFDGYLARRYNWESRLGAILDPIADKILATASLVLLAGAGSHCLPVYLAALLLCREVAILGLRLIALEHQIEIKVSGLGKTKTFIQDLSIFLLMTNIESLFIPGILCCWAALGFSYFSAYLYWEKFWQKSSNLEKSTDSN